MVKKQLNLNKTLNRSKKMKKLTLEQLIEVGKGAPHDGEFGLTACKEEIKFLLEIYKRHCKERSLYALLAIYVDRANADTNDLLYHATMVYACWQLINGN